MQGELPNLKEQALRIDLVYHSVPESFLLASLAQEVYWFRSRVVSIALRVRLRTTQEMRLKRSPIPDIPSQRLHFRRLYYSNSSCSTLGRLLHHSSSPKVCVSHRMTARMLSAMSHYDKHSLYLRPFRRTTCQLELVFRNRPFFRKLPDQRSWRIQFHRSFLFRRWLQLIDLACTQRCMSSQYISLTHPHAWSANSFGPDIDHTFSRRQISTRLRAIILYARYLIDRPLSASFLVGSRFRWMNQSRYWGSQPGDQVWCQSGGIVPGRWPMIQGRAEKICSF